VTVRVILEFDDEEGAKEVCRQVVNTGNVVGVKLFADAGDGYPSARYFAVVARLKGVFKVPTKFCEDAEPGHRVGKKTHQGWARSKNYGWWVDSVCKRPTRAWANGDRWAHTLGSNLVPTEISGEERPWGWKKSSAEWTFLLEEVRDTEPGSDAVEDSPESVPSVLQGPDDRAETSGS
jgi:hypothetical protein